MSRPVAVGVGCRKGCGADIIETLVRRSLSGIPAATPVGLFTVRDKEAEPGIREAARRLGVAVVYLRREALQAQSNAVRTRSARVEAAVGVASVAEAAALAGAGPHAILVVPRIAEGGATCALAEAQPVPA